MICWKVRKTKTSFFIFIFFTFLLIFLHNFFNQNFSRFFGFPTIPNLFQSNKNCRSYDAKCKILPSENEQTLIISTRIFPSSLTYSFMYFYTDMRIYFCKELFVAQWPGEIISRGGGLSDENCPKNTLSVKFSIY